MGFIFIFTFICLSTFSQVCIIFIEIILLGDRVLNGIFLMLKTNTTEWISFQMISKIQLKDQVTATMNAGPWPESLQATSSILLQHEQIYTVYVPSSKQGHYVIIQWRCQILGMGPNSQTQQETAGLPSHTVHQSFSDYRGGI